MKPTFAIVVPVYNRAGIVGRTLGSIAAQTYRPLQVILVDNNSTDSTLAVLAEWQKAHVADDFQVEVVSETSKGASAARNAGLRMVDAEWTVFFDSDDVMAPDHIERVAEAIQLCPDAEMVGWDRRTRQRNGRVVYKPFVIELPHIMAYENITHGLLSTLSYAARTALFRKAGGWDSALTIGEDIELGARILALQPVIDNIPGHCVDIYEMEDSITYNVDERASSLWLALKKIRATLPDKYKHWADLHMINSAASWAKNEPQAREIVARIISDTAPVRRLLWRLFYRYGLLGGRGVARIYRILSFNTLRL